MVFSYVVLQALPPTLSLFQQSTGYIYTFCRTPLWEEEVSNELSITMNLYTCRVVKQAVNSEVSVFGGVSVKVKCFMH